MYHYFIGIDISKADFYVAIHGKKKVYVFPNSTDGFVKFTEHFQNLLKDSLVILETTGGYEIPLVEHLQNQACAIHRANTRKVKSFINSYGIIGKTDTKDAVSLALYGFERHGKLELFKENPYKKLLKLVQRRKDLKHMLVQEKNRLQAPDQKYLSSSFEKIIKVLDSEAQRITQEIEEIFKANIQFEELRKVLKSISGVGDMVASYLIALLPELGLIDRKKIASLAGLAPHPNESGQKKGYRSIKGGREDVRSILFLAAMTASRSKSNLGDFYKKLTASGKKKMVAMTALMRKILVIANARARDYFLLSKSAQHG